MSPPPVIVLASFKGGVGKSTVAACLAGHWLKAGLSPALVDADPQGSLATWHQPGPLASLRLVSDKTIQVARTIAGLAREHRPVIVDTAGTDSPVNYSALAAADLAIIPVRASVLDIAVAERVRRIIGRINTEARTGPPLEIRVLLSMVTQRSTVAATARQQMTDAGWQLLSAELVNRVGYSEALWRGSAPSIDDPNGAAAQEIAALAAEIEALKVPA